MSTENSDQGNRSAGLGGSIDTGSSSPGRGADRDANIPGAAPRGGAEYSADRPNFGSARSDYGDLAYGGRLDKRGLESGRRDYDRGRRDIGSKGYERPGRRSISGGGGSAGLMLLYGAGIGAALMYILDPDQGRRRRALLRDKLVSMSNKTSDAVGRTSRDLRNRAQGVIHEAGSMLGLQDQGNQRGEDQQQSREQQAGAAGA